MKIPLKYLVPNAFTILSMVCGLASMAASVKGDYASAAWLICWGVLLDKLDGSAARLLKASSEFGAQLDSFADFVVFGLAPSALTYFGLEKVEPYNESLRPLLLLSVAFYVVTTSARLARFNISTPPGGKNTFYGIPTTLCGALVALSYLCWEAHALSPQLLLALPAALLVLGVAMVSQIRLPKLKPRKDRLFNYLQFGNVLAAYILGALRVAPQVMLLQVVSYLVVGVLWAALHPPEPEVALNEP